MSKQLVRRDADGERLVDPEARVERGRAQERRDDEQDEQRRAGDAAGWRRTRRRARRRPRGSGGRARRCRGRAHRRALRPTGSSRRARASTCGAPARRPGEYQRARLIVLTWKTTAGGSGSRSTCADVQVQPPGDLRDEERPGVRRGRSALRHVLAAGVVDERLEVVDELHLVLDAAHVSGSASASGATNGDRQRERGARPRRSAGPRPRRSSRDEPHDARPRRAR